MSIDLRGMTPLIQVFLNQHPDIHCGFPIARNQPESESLASVPRWRTACLMGGHKLVSHGVNVFVAILRIDRSMSEITRLRQSSRSAVIEEHCPIHSESLIV
jgi:hypothetical protein